nr:MAG TPA: tail protein [Caudoviricetes sp.]
MVFTLKTGVYLHTAYAQASDGSVGFSTTSATDAAYLGQYTDASATDATDPSRYTWMPIDLGAGAELVNEAGEEVDDGTEGLIDLLDRDLYDTGQFAPDTQATGDRKVQTYFQPDEPDPEEYVFGVGDLWQDTDDGNHLYRWNGTAWVDAQDGGIGAATELAQAADTKATTAGEKAQAVQTALAGLTKIQDEQVLIDGDKVYLSAAFVRSIFAQDITATGTITGAQLIGAILSGNAIDIQAVIDATSIGLKTELVDNSYCLVLSAAGGTTKSSITLSRGSLKLVGQSLLELSTNELYINANTITDGNYSKANYSSFSGSVVSDGTVTVTKKFGVCYLNGGITLTGAVSGWVTLLDSNAVPAPQNGEAIIMTLPSWKAPTTNPARLRIPADGGLQITRGSANAFWINLAYPIN